MSTEVTTDYIEIVIHPIARNIQTLLTNIINLVKDVTTLKIIMIATLISLVAGFTIIVINQQKIRKELRQLREMIENQNKPE